MKFKTVIKHVNGSEVSVAGEVFPLDPDADGFAVIDTDNEAVIARLLEIPEGFRPLDEAPAAGPRFVLKSDEGDSLILDALDDDALRKFAADNGVKVHHKAKGDTLRAAIVAGLNG